MPGQRTALVTGAGGFCATHLAACLASDAGTSVVGLGRRREPSHSAGLADYVSCDVTDRTRLAQALRAIRPDWVFHLAGTSSGDRRHQLATNARGTENLLAALLRECPEASAVVMGTAAEYGQVPPRHLPVVEERPCRPRTAYGVSKYAATRAALRLHRAHGLRVIVARPFNMIGPLIPQSVVLGAVLRQIRDAIALGRRPAEVRVGPTDAQRDFVRVEDVAEALVRMVRGAHWGGVFNLCTGIATSVRTLLDLVAAAVDWPVHFTRVPSRGRRGGPNVMYGSYARAAQAFGFAPSHDLEAAVRHTCRVELGVAPTMA